MNIYNIFNNRGIVAIIPFFVAIYISFIDPNLRWVGLFLGIDISVYYVIVITLARDVSSSRPSSESEALQTIVNRRNVYVSAATSVIQWSIALVSIYLLSKHLNDLIAYTFLWLLIAGYLFSFLYVLIVHWKVIVMQFLKPK